MYFPILFAALPSFSALSSQLIPAVLLALLLDSALMAAWYLAGVALNRADIKGSAKAEFYQLVGTAILISIISGLLIMYSSSFASLLHGTSLDPVVIANTCNSIESNTMLQILDSNSIIMAGSYKYINNADTANGFPGLCTIASSAASTQSDTSNLDYPLAASGIIIANLTNQTAFNLNNLFIVDSYIGYMSSLSETYGYCLQPGPDPFGPCILPPTSIASPTIMFIYASMKPFAGYNVVYQSLGPIANLLATSFESFIAQLLGISIFLYIWPFLLFFGLLFRALPFTRKIGGLFIAIAIGAIVVYPFIFAVEYLNMYNGLSNVNSSQSLTFNSIYGFNSLLPTVALPAIPCSSSVHGALASCTLSTDQPITYGSNIIVSNNENTEECQIYKTNFFVQPNISTIAMLNGCWPGKSMVAAMFGDDGYLMLPLASSASILMSLIGNNGNGFFSNSGLIYTILQQSYLPYKCGPIGAKNTAYMLTNAYGIIGVTSYWLPLLNIFITLIAIIGLSRLLGGDTNLAGLSKLV
ncbi:MAG: hypothetical protein QXD11_00150 [Candidatus Micrarchaeaceae archaeon]